MTLHAVAPLFGLALVPGLLVGLALGLRGWVLAGAAPVLTFGVIGTVAAVAPSWSPTVLLAAAVVLAAVAAAARTLAARRFPVSPLAAEERRHWLPVQHAVVLGAVAVSAAVGLWVGWNATQGLTAYPQEWDGFWHLNAIAFIADTGQAAPSALADLKDSTGPFFYPNGYHVLLATLVSLTGVSPVAALNASVLLIPAVFAAGCVALVRAVGGRASIAAATGLLACAFTGFPFDVIAFGPLYPYTTGLALLPGALAVLVLLLDQWSENPLGVPAAVAIAAIGLLAVHPSVLIAATVMGAALLVQRLVERRLRPTDLGRLVVTGVLTAILGAPAILATLGAASGQAFDWPATSTPSEAVGALVTFGHGQQFPQYWLALLCLVGVFQRRLLRPIIWFVCGGAVFAALFVAATCYEGPLVAALTRPWWNDGWRFAALWTLAAVPLAGVGVAGLVDALARTARRLPRVSSRTAVVASVLVVGVVLVVGTDGLYHQRNERRVGEMYFPARTLTADEVRTYAYVATLVEPGERVMNDPYDGSPALYAVAGVRPMFASPTFGDELEAMDPDHKLLWTAFDTIATDPAVRSAAQRLGVRYVVVGEGLVGRTDHIPGLDRAEDSPALELVHVDGGARVYRITG